MYLVGENVFIRWRSNAKLYNNETLKQRERVYVIIVEFVLKTLKFSIQFAENIPQMSSFYKNKNYGFS